MTAMEGNSEPANLSTNVARESFDAGDKASCAVGQATEANDSKWALSSSKLDMDCESYGSSKLSERGAFEQKKETAEVGNSILGGKDFYSQKQSMAEESYGSGRFLLSCAMASARAKKKRRSRATSKAPIKVFSTDTSNFMAMVHKLTGIPSNTFPAFYSPPPLAASSKQPPFKQGLPTLDTSSILLSCDSISSGGAYSGLQALPSQQLLNSLALEMKTSNQAGQSVDATSLSYSDLMRSMCSGNVLNLPHLWEASHLKQKSVPHKVQESCISEREGNSRPEVSQEGVTNESNAPISSHNVLSSEILLATHGKFAAPTDAWVPSSSFYASNTAKEELL